MAWVAAGGQEYDVDLVIFDKDGTLVDFLAMWARLFELQLEQLRRRLGEQPALMADLCASMGYTPAGRAIDPYGPLALATNTEIRVILSVVLYRHGWKWDTASAWIEEIMDRRQWPPLEELVQPIGDVVGLLRALRQAGALVGVVTTDARDLTAHMLALIGAAPYVTACNCADDGLPLKPAPDGILDVCRQAGVPPARAVMVGDSPTDLLAAQAAGLAGRVGVLSGVSRREALEPLADVLITSVRELRVRPA